MNRIVRQNYPVSKLPEDLRIEFGAVETVTLTIEGAGETVDADAQDPVNPDQDALPRAGQGQFSRFKHLRQEHYQSIEEVNDYVRSLRDEWDDRDRLLNEGR